MRAAEPNRDFPSRGLWPLDTRLAPGVGCVWCTMKFAQPEGAAVMPVTGNMRDHRRAEQVHGMLAVAGDKTPGLRFERKQSVRSELWQRLSSASLQCPC